MRWLAWWLIEAFASDCERLMLALLGSEATFWSLCLAFYYSFSDLHLMHMAVSGCLE